MGKPLGCALRRRLFALPIPLALVVAGCAGCGSTGGEATTATTESQSPADQPTTIASSSTSRPDPFATATAASLVLAEEDLGAGWSPGITWYGTLCNSETNPENTLTNGDPPEVDLARASLQSDEVAIIEAVALFATPAMAQQRLDGWRNTLTACGSRVSIDVDPEHTFQMVTSELGPYGEESWVSALTVVRSGETLAGYEVVYRRGRAIVHVKVVANSATLPEERAEELLDYVQAKATPPDD